MHDVHPKGALTVGAITMWSELAAGGVKIGGRVPAELGCALVDEHSSDRIVRQDGLTRFEEPYGFGSSLIDLVRFVAPMAQRVQRIVASHGPTDVAAVEEHLREDDIAHRKFVNRFYNRDANEPAGYGLTVDTRSASVHDATYQVVEAARSALRTSAVAAATMTAAIDVDPVLAAAIADVMEEPAPATTA